MSAPATPGVSRVSERLLTFEVEGSVYALPIAQVLEVAERGRITCVPTLPRHCGGVMNWHGDAIPVLSARMVLDEGAVGETKDSDGSPEEGGEHVLVISDRRDALARLGLPIDQVLGLVDGAEAAPPGKALVVERRSVDGRVVSILDPVRLVERAGRLIDEAVD